MDPRSWQLSAFHISYWYLRLFWFVLLILLAVAAFVYGVFPLVWQTGLGFAPPLVRIAALSPIWLIGLWLLTALVWVVVFPWHSLRFRDVAWWAARALGWLRQWLFTGWRGMCVILGAVTLLAWVYSQLIGARHQLQEYLSPQGGLRVLAAVAVIVVSYWAISARKRIVVLPFTNYTGDEKLQDSVNGMASQLIQRLVGLSDLYRTVEETSLLEVGDAPSSDQAHPQATISTADVGQTLQGIVSADSKLSVGPLQVPVGALMGILGRIVEGPRLTGSLHLAGDQLILIATFSGERASGYWRVSQQDVEEPPPTALAGAETAKPYSMTGSQIIERMVEQLAYRVFTTLEQDSLGSPRWRAIRSFSEGLLAYRRTHRTMRDRLFNLRQAERAFIQALADDNKFARCHYNLGVVYTRLGNRDAARDALLHAVQEDPGMTNAYLALAFDAWAREAPEDYRATLRYSDQAIRLEPDMARAWHIKGRALHKLYNLSKTGQAAQSLDLAALAPSAKDVMETLATATALAWRALCMSALRGQLRQAQKVIASSCEHSFATISSRGHARTLMQQAIRLVPTGADLYYLLGQVLEDDQDWSGAADAFTSALRIAEQPWYWAHLAYAYAQLASNSKLDQARREAHRQAAQEACRRVLYNAASAGDDALKVVHQAWQKLDDVGHARMAGRIRGMRRWLSKRKSDSDGGLGACRGLAARLKRKTDSRAAHNLDWTHAQFNIMLAQRCLDVSATKDHTRASLGKKAEDLLLDAIKLLKPAAMDKKEKQDPLKMDHSGEIREWGLYALLARACVSQKKLDQALDYAERAVKLNPERAFERLVLGLVYWALDDHERAVVELSSSLDLDPTRPDTIQEFCTFYKSARFAGRQISNRQIWRVTTAKTRQNQLKCKICKTTDYYLDCQYSLESRRIDPQSRATSASLPTGGGDTRPISRHLSVCPIRRLGTLLDGPVLL